MGKNNSFQNSGLSSLNSGGPSSLNSGLSIANSGLSSAEFSSGGASQESGDAFRVQSTTTSRKEYRALDSSVVLKAFRLIGGVDGIKEKQLQLALTKLPNKVVRNDVLSKLHDIFVKHDVRKTGSIDVFEFDQMLGNSALLEKAIYELMELFERSDDLEDLEDLGSMFNWNAQLEYASSLLVILNFLVMAVATDNDPDWLGWQAVELVFVILFATDIFLRFKSARTLRAYASSRMNIFDVLITTIVAIDVVVSLSLSGSTSWGMLAIFRVARLFRLGRVVKVICSCKELTTVIQTIVDNFRSFAWTFVVLALALFLWAVIIRQSLFYGWTEDDSGALHAAFPSVPESMLWMVRCWVLSSKNSCTPADGTELYDHLSDGVGWFFKITWVVIELFVCLGVLNVLTATFVLNMTKADRAVEEAFATSPSKQAIKVALVRRLDKLLRALTHPHRQQISPKDRNVATVAAYIHSKLPDCAAKMTNMSKTLVDFAEAIQEAQAIHANAVQHYAAQENEAYQELLSLPSAKMYFFDGAERLMVCDNGDLGKPAANMGLRTMPAGAIEVSLIQESHDLEELLKEAEEVQRFVKSKIQVSHKMEYVNPTLWSSASSASSGALFTCSEIVDPGPKSRGRVCEKVETKYKGRYERNRDYARLGLVFDTIESLLRSVKAMLNSSLGNHGVQVVSIENRFVEPSALGWRDVSVLLKVRSPSSGRNHVMELQLNLRGLNEIRHCTHEFYEKVRAVLPQDAVSVVIDKLTNNTTLDLDISQQEWQACLKNTEVSSILDQLKIPFAVRRDAIEILDADGSGKVSTHELRDGLLQCSDDLGLSGGMIDCKLKVREIQQWLRNQMEPQLQIFQETLRTFDRRHREELSVMKSLVQAQLHVSSSDAIIIKRGQALERHKSDQITNHPEIDDQHQRSRENSQDSSLSASKVSPKLSNERNHMEPEALSGLAPRLVSSAATDVTAATFSTPDPATPSILRLPVGNDVAGTSPTRRWQQVQSLQESVAETWLQVEHAAMAIQRLSPRSSRTSHPGRERL